MKLITITTFNNCENTIRQCIESLKNQYYTNFTSYLIDNMSTDNSYEIAKQLVGNDDRFILIKNKTKKNKTKNILDVLNDNVKINWDDVIIDVDCNGYLSNKHVFGLINKTFMNHNVWICNGRLEDKNGILNSQNLIIPENIRTNILNFHNVRFYRSFLFRAINPEHLNFEILGDLSSNIPMLEMSGSEHFIYLDESLFTYNQYENNLTDEVINLIQTLPEYERLILINKNKKNINKRDLSIVIPSYGNPNFTKECLESVINSIKNFNCEILVGIDSCVQTFEFVKSNTFDDRIKFYYFQRNVGPYVVKNSLSQISNSDYILFFDSDDIMVEELINDIVIYKSEYDLIKPMYLDFQRDVVNINHKSTHSNTYGEGVFGINKELFLGLNGFEGWRCAADSELMGRLYKNKVKMTHTKRIGFYRRIHKDSLTQHPETNYFSKLRGTYHLLSKRKKYHGPLDNITVEPFDLIDSLSSQYDETEMKITKEEKMISIKEKLKFNIKKTSTPIDYDTLNNLNNNTISYNPSKNIKPIRENTPVNRNELFELKKGTLAEQNKRFFPMKRKLDL